MEKLADLIEKAGRAGKELGRQIKLEKNAGRHGIAITTAEALVTGLSLLRAIAEAISSDK